MIVASSRAIYGEGKYYCKNDGLVYPYERKESDLKKGIFNPFCPICGGSIELRATDEESRIHPSSIYGITKQQQEEMILLIGDALKIPAVAVGLCAVLPEGSLIASVEPEASNA